MLLFSAHFLEKPTSALAASESLLPGACGCSHVTTSGSAKAERRTVSVYGTSQPATSIGSDEPCRRTFSQSQGALSTHVRNTKHRGLGGTIIRQCRHASSAIAAAFLQSQPHRSTARAVAVGFLLRKAKRHVAGRRPEASQRSSYAGAAANVERRSQSRCRPLGASSSPRFRLLADASVIKPERIDLELNVVARVDHSRCRHQRSKPGGRREIDACRNAARSSARDQRQHRDGVVASRAGDARRHRARVDRTGRGARRRDEITTLRARARAALRR